MLEETKILTVYIIQEIHVSNKPVLTERQTDITNYEAA